MTKAPRNYSIDLLRILACFAVVMAHVIGVPIMQQKALPGTFDYNLCLFLIGVRRWGVPIFLMITGFFMLDPVKEVTLKKLYTKNTLRILTALIFWSFIRKNSFTMMKLKKWVDMFTNCLSGRI